MLYLSQVIPAKYKAATKEFKLATILSRIMSKVKKSIQILNKVLQRKNIDTTGFKVILLL